MIKTKRFNKYFINNYSIIDTNSNFLKINKKKKISLFKQYWS